MSRKQTSIFFPPSNVAKRNNKAKPKQKRSEMKRRQGRQCRHENFFFPFFNPLPDYCNQAKTITRSSGFKNWNDTPPDEKYNNTELSRIRPVISKSEPKVATEEHAELKRRRHIRSSASFEKRQILKPRQLFPPCFDQPSFEYEPGEWKMALRISFRETLSHSRTWLIPHRAAESQTRRQ